jgi:Ser/Thr protein kinase RdoA (MazF antagonist)
VLKQVIPPSPHTFGREPAVLRSHRRKLRSYAVEQAFYERYASRCAPECRVPAAVLLSSSAERWLFVLEDLDAAGFPERRRRLAAHELALCLRWLARFHGTFMGASTEGLWKVGTYWHLATRPDELSRLPDGELRAAAPRIDERLNAARFKTLVHGDAKLENFCFAERGESVAMLDFQYAGGGVGVKDVAYFLSSCLSADESEATMTLHLDTYFEELDAVLARRAAGGAPMPERAALEAEWRALFPFAVADLRRFLLGWAPEAYEHDPFSDGLLRQALKAL